MIIVLKSGTKNEEIEKLIESLSKYDVEVNPIVGSSTTVLGLVGDTLSVDANSIQLNENVDKILKVQEPYKRANRKLHPENHVVDVNGVKIGGGGIVVIAGPCSVESEMQIIDIARNVKAKGAEILRGGAWKPRTSPYSFQGLQADGLELLKLAKQDTNMPVVSEITNPSHIEMFLDVVDMFQVGARNMQNFELLKELGKINKPVMIKRGFANTYEELLMSAEYVMSGGNNDVVLCERGIRTCENYTRNTLDISAIPALKKLSHLPVIVDPSHAAGINWMVEPLSLAAVAAGADGLIIEVHNDPKNALCDGAQSLTYDLFEGVMNKIKLIADTLGRVA